MRKKFLSFLLVLIFAFPLMFFVPGCNPSQNQDTNPPSEDEGNNSSGDSSQGDTTPLEDTISTLYDLRITYYKPEYHALDNPYGGTLIWLPDGKTMLINPVITKLADFVFFYSDFTNYSKYEDGGSRMIIDYLIVTAPTEIAVNKGFWGDFVIKNYYRPDIEIDFNYWEEPYSTYDYGLEIEDFYAISKENLEGRSLEYFDHTWLSNSLENAVRYYGYDYSYQYIASLAHVEKQGGNIIKTANTSDIITTLVYKSSQYSYTSDFYVPESKVTPNPLYLQTHKDGPSGDVVLLNDNNQTAEYGTILSIEYRGFNVLCLNTLTENLLSSFLSSNPQNKKYDVLVGSLRHGSVTENNLHGAVSKNIEYYQSEYDKNIMSVIFDSSKVETNYIFLNTADDTTNNEWTRKGATMDLFIFNYPGTQEKYVSYDNLLIPCRASGIKTIIPIIIKCKDGIHSIKEIKTDLDLVTQMGPTVDGVLV
jgi:hypothetical protein